MRITTSEIVQETGFLTALLQNRHHNISPDTTLVFADQLKGFAGGSNLLGAEIRSVFSVSVGHQMRGTHSFKSIKMSSAENGTGTKKSKNAFELAVG